MKNTLSFTKFLASLGCNLRLGYYWSAASEDNKRVIVTIWDDQVINDEYLLLDEDAYPSWMKLPGAYELKRHVQMALGQQTEVLGVLCHAKDPQASPRIREYYDEKSLLVLRLEQRGKTTHAAVVGEVGVKEAIAGKVAHLSTDRKSAINDLDSVPAGSEMPEKHDIFGSVFKRNQMVRDYVLARAKGCCEFCKAPGFQMANGNCFLEAHHIIALSSQGADTPSNVIALCPNHHREAHFGANSDELNIKMLNIVRALT